MVLRLSMSRAARVTSGEVSVHNADKEDIQPNQQLLDALPRDSARYWKFLRMPG
jgi:hypothetical protein